MKTTRIEIRPGEGGDDAVEFARELVSAVTARFRKQSITYTTDTSSDRTYTITYRGAEKLVSGLAGTHRVQRIPGNGGGRRHTSTATLVVLSGSQPEPVGIDDADIWWEPYRSSGPGGQNKNKSQTAVRMRHVPTGVEVVATRERSLNQNYQMARSELERLICDSVAVEQAAEVNAERVRQMSGSSPSQRVGGREAKDFTHNYQRGEVVSHRTGKRIDVKAFYRGRWGSLVK